MELCSLLAAGASFVTSDVYDERLKASLGQAYVFTGNAILLKLSRLLIYLLLGSSRAATMS